MYHHPWHRTTDFRQTPTNRQTPEYYGTPQWQRKITIEEAMAIALNQVPGQIVKVELEHKNGVLIYEVEIVNAQGVKYEVEIDVNSGTVLSVELD